MRSLMCLTALAAVLLLPSTAGAATPFSLGVQDDNVLEGRSAQMSAATGLGVMDSIHATTARFNVAWTSVLTSSSSATAPPATPQYDFGNLDAGVNAVTAAGHTAYLTINGPAPAWATATKKAGVTKVDPAAFARFAAAVAEHFAGRVAAVSVWNEPNWPTTLAPVKVCKKIKRKKVCTDTRPTLYRNLYAAAYTAIKKADPSLPVWIGELAPQGRSTTKGAALAPLSFLRAALCVDTKVKKKSCAGLKTDGLAVHPYLLGAAPTKKPATANDLSMAVLSRAGDLLSKLEKLKALRRSNGKAGIPLQLTEFGYLTTGTARSVTVGQQAAYIPQAIGLARKAKRVRSLYLYQLIDSDNPDVTWNSGLYYADGKPKPVVAKLAALRR